MIDSYITISKQLLSWEGTYLLCISRADPTIFEMSSMNTVSCLKLSTMTTINVANLKFISVYKLIILKCVSDFVLSGLFRIGSTDDFYNLFFLFRGECSEDFRDDPS